MFPRISALLGQHDVSSLSMARPSLDGTNAMTKLLSMNKDQSHGAAKNIKGRIKEAAGVLTGNKAE